jgi:hypothetical protein
MEGKEHHCAFEPNARVPPQQNQYSKGVKTMGTLLERIQNVFDDRQDRVREQSIAGERSEAYSRALQDIRDALLASALVAHQDWRQQLAGSEPGQRDQVNARYEARFQGLNDALAALRQGDPGITTQLNVEQFREKAQAVLERPQDFRQYSLEGEQQTRGRVPAGGDRGYDYGSSYGGAA